jgi:hypothetical protein
MDAVGVTRARKSSASLLLPGDFKGYGAAGERPIAELARLVITPAIGLACSRNPARVLTADAYRREAQPPCHGHWTRPVLRRSITKLAQAVQPQQQAAPAVVRPHVEPVPALLLATRWHALNPTGALPGGRSSARGLNGSCENDSDE